uniref:Gustatory receptor n=1 Tax=Timema californicum TaxID=61474 RepID=A0A7R9JHK5_TIMCA|nr:unnamed protein product [Timema californicum]
MPIKARVSSILFGRSFYNSFQPLALVCKLVGPFPLINLFQNDVFLLRRRWLSAHVFVPLAIHATALCVSKFLEPAKWWSFITPYYYLPRSVVVILLSLYYDQFLPKLIVFIESFDANITEIARGIYFPNRSSGKMIWFSSGVIAILYLFLSLDIDVMISCACRPRILLDVCNTLPLASRELYAIMFAFFCHNLTVRFRHFKSLLEYSVSTKVEVASYGLETRYVRARRLEENLEAIRLYHTKLSQAVSLLNDCYGIRISFYFITVTVEILLDLYMCFMSHKIGIPLKPISFVIINLVTFWLIAEYAGRLFDTNREILDHLKLIPVLPMNRDSQFQVMMVLVTNFIVMIQLSQLLKPITDKFVSDDELR